MVSKTNEQALEASIEKYLTGTCLEEQNVIRDRGRIALQHPSRLPTGPRPGL
ncbi:hypothetical protein [Pseudomonas congelans]|uniref:hypothetical protein n=1 Tax=Pseudomonas congelans TaxID=200452 RepID=UPI001EFE1979|nr:hypothetical protein [Pseudomonas congelans]